MSAKDMRVPSGREIPNTHSVIGGATDQDITGACGSAADGHKDRAAVSETSGGNGGA